MIANVTRLAPVPGTYPNLTVWVTPIWGAGTPTTQAEFENCLSITMSDQTPPLTAVQIVNGSYGIAVAEEDANAVVVAMQAELGSCLEP